MPFLPPNQIRSDPSWMPHSSRPFCAWDMPQVAYPLERHHSHTHKGTLTQVQILVVNHRFIQQQRWKKGI